MKRLLLLLFIGLSAISFGRRGLGELMPYTVIADSMESAVPVGFCLVKGFAYDYGSVVPNGKVSTLDGEYSTFTDSTGEYKLLIPSTDTSIFFFKTQFNEVVVWNYNFQSQHVVTLNFNSSANNSMKISAKPVIYLYSDEEIDVELDLDYHGELTFTYPELVDKWEAKVNKEGIECQGKEYPYLFWEGESAELNFNYNSDESINGEFVEKSQIITFLDQKLDEIGLNQTEKTDFITFWAPKMITTNYVLVQFIVDEDYDELIANLNVNPKPDASKRLYMYFSGFDSPHGIQTHSQSFKSFKREGFTLLEWGGTQIELEKIKL